MTLSVLKLENSDRNCQSEHNGIKGMKRKGKKGKERKQRNIIKIPFFKSQVKFPTV